MSNNDLRCSKCKAQHHPADNCQMPNNDHIFGGLTNVFGCKCNQEDCEPRRCNNYFQCESLTKMMEADRRRCLDEVEKPLKEYDMRTLAGSWKIDCLKANSAVNSALAKIEELKGERK